MEGETEQYLVAFESFLETMDHTRDGCFGNQMIKTLDLLSSFNIEVKIAHRNRYGKQCE